MEQLGLISMENLFTPWNNASQSSKCYVHEIGPCSSLMKQPTMQLEGQCEPLVQRLHARNGPMQGCTSRQQYIILAHAIVSHSCLPYPWFANAGQFSKYCVYAIGPCKSLYLLLTGYHTNPCGSLVLQSAISLMGQCKPVVQMLHSCNGPMRWLCLRLTEHHAGPCSSLIQ